MNLFMAVGDVSVAHCCYPIFYLILLTCSVKKIRDYDGYNNTSKIKLIIIKK